MTKISGHARRAGRYTTHGVTSQERERSTDGCTADRAAGIGRPRRVFRGVLQATGGPLKALSIRTVQVNIGLRCDLSCRHCHVESSPGRREQMKWETMKLAIDAARKVRAATLDITGGEPMLHPQFRRLVEESRAAGLQAMVRTNLIVLLQKGREDLPQFLQKHRVRLVGSLPSCEESIVDFQRGAGVFRDSITAIKRLNAVGYGIDPTLPLDLVHHPPGPLIPPTQSLIERDYKRQLDGRFGIRFTQLFTIANMPIAVLAKTWIARENGAVICKSCKPPLTPTRSTG